MTEETEMEQLRELGEELAGQTESLWQPRILSRAFSTLSGHCFTLTMQGWIDLDFARSPLLAGGDLEEVEQLRGALVAFGHEVTDPTQIPPADMAVIVGRMKAAVSRAFATIIKMRHPNAASAAGNDGFGLWAPIMAALIAQLRMSRSDALACPVDQTFALLAGVRHNEGWTVTSEPYANREVM